MQYCLWTICDQRYATPAERITEVISLVQPRPVSHTPPWVRGLMHYRGALLPLIDGAVLLGHDPVQPRRAARILVLDCPDDSGEAARLGLVVEHVAGVEALDFDEPDAHPGLTLPDADYLGPLLNTAQGAVQLIELDRLLTPAQRELLFGRLRETS